MDIEIKPEPFSKEELEKLKRDSRLGKIRRFGAIVSHQKLRFSHNALVAWRRSPPGNKLCAALKEKEYLSHIYLRKPHRLWPYSLYTMVHAKANEELNIFIDELSRLLNCRDFRVLNTVKELKKTSFNPASKQGVRPGQ
ncbi:MAG: Lrp/AsnC family transcriptional regulator [Candidatus Omnitrophota bacterium]